MNENLRPVIEANEELMKLIESKEPLIEFESWYFNNGIVENMNFVMYCKDNKTIRLIVLGNNRTRFMDKLKQELLK